MAGYATSARLQGAVPRFAGASARLSTVRPATEPLSTSEPPSDADRLELVGRPFDEMIAEWLASVGEAWSQLTFFLFDSESWR